jgi:hypothetical protein
LLDHAPPQISIHQAAFRPRHRFTQGAIADALSQREAG